MGGALRRPRAFWISTCNIFGLACSLAGVVLLFWFALPNTVPGGPQALGAVVLIQVGRLKIGAMTGSLTLVWFWFLSEP